MKSLSEILTGQPVHTLPGTTPVLEAVRTMTRLKVGAILVLDDCERLVGIFTERDLMARVVVPGRDPGEVRLEEVMTSDLLIAEPEARLNDVAQRMQDRHIRHLPVVREGRVVGILSLRDLLRAHLDEKVQEVNALTAYIQGEGADIEGPLSGGPETSGDSGSSSAEATG